MDAAGELARRLDSSQLKASILRWLPLAEKTASRRFSVTTELYGRTSIRRDALDRAVGRAAAAAFPRWRPSQREGVRLLCKADAENAVLGIQLYSNLGDDQDGLPGALRRHLACDLLTVAGVEGGNTVFDPLMGTGTILGMAADRYGAALGIGLEVDADAYRAALTRLQDAERPWSTRRSRTSTTHRCPLGAGSSPTCPSASGSPRYVRLPCCGSSGAGS